MENKNTIIALVLMAVVWFGFSFLFPQQPTPVTVAEPSRVEQPATKKSTLPALAETAAPIIPVATGTFASSPARDIEISTDVFNAVFTTSGARLKSLSLNNFKVTTAEDSPLVHIADAQSLAESTLQTEGLNGWLTPVDAIYQADFSGGNLALTGKDSRSLVFSWQDETGIRIEKTYQFVGNRYDCKIQVKVSNLGTTVRQGSLLLNLVHPWTEDMQSSRLDFVGPVTLVKDKLYSEKIKDLEKAIKVYQNPVWTAFETKYFMAALVPLTPGESKITLSKQGPLVLNSLETPPSSLAPGESSTFDYLTYLGPRDLDIVKQVDHRLDESIDFGFFSLIALPLRHVLMFFYGYVGNFGVAIILLTVIIKLLFWPLTQKSYTSMKSMQKLQPEMQRLREKYKNDKERLNKEMMLMYKEKRVNPLGGCLPMVVQIPVFFALYKTLMVDIGLRHAPFAFWLTDLSAKDPYYITPLIMGVTMFIQQKMSPSSMDPKQAKIFMMMPVIFTFMFLNFPAGLVIYWLVNNLLTIFQQYLIHRKTA
jgi:YidC/Oxa1 family membrane protein insertase